MPIQEKNRRKTHYLQKHEKDPPGRPSEYDPKFCQMLIDHMKNGNSFESFGAVVMKGRATLYEWEAAHKDFADARAVGLSLSLRFYEDMGKGIAAGQVRFVTERTPVLTTDKDGKAVPVYDKKGEIVMKEKIVPARAGQSTWDRIMSNMHGWRNKHDVRLTGADGGPVRYSNLTDDELDKVEKELLASLKKVK